MDEGKPINLFKEMQKIVDKYVEHYQTDFTEHDIPMLLNEKYNTNSFYWLIHSCGTHMLEKEFVISKRDWGNGVIHVYGQYSDLKVYEINISKRARKYVYGTIKKINAKKFYEYVIENEKDPVSVDIDVYYYQNAVDMALSKVTLNIKYDEEYERHTYLDNAVIRKLKIDKSRLFAGYVVKYNYKE